MENYFNELFKNLTIKYYNIEFGYFGIKNINELSNDDILDLKNITISKIISSFKKQIFLELKKDKNKSNYFMNNYYSLFNQNMKKYGNIILSDINKKLKSDINTLELNQSYDDTIQLDIQIKIEYIESFNLCYIHSLYFTDNYDIEDAFMDKSEVNTRIDKIYSKLNEVELNINSISEIIRNTYI